MRKALLIGVQYLRTVRIHCAFTQFGVAWEVRLVSAPDRVAEDVVRYSLRDSGVAVLTLNRPERMIKQQVYADTMRDVFEASAVAEKLMGESMLRPDFVEGITSFFEKRPPHFPPLVAPERT